MVVAPLSAAAEAHERLQQCPVKEPGSGFDSSSATSFPTPAIMFLPIGTEVNFVPDLGLPVKNKPAVGLLKLGRSSWSCFR